MSQTSGPIFQTFAMVAGDQADALVFQFPTVPTPSSAPVVQSITLSAATPAFTWALFFAPAAAAVAGDIVVVDSILLTATAVDPVAATPVVNRRITCRDYPVPRVGTVPMGLRVTTTGKTGTGTIRIQWNWKDPG